MGWLRKTLRLPSDLVNVISQIATAEGREWSAAARVLLEEAARQRHFPGIIFLGGPSGRRAHLAGTGLDVWEVVAACRAVGDDFQALAREWSWVPGALLRLALAYYQTYPEEINRRLEIEETWTPERVRSTLSYIVSPT